MQTDPSLAQHFLSVLKDIKCEPKVVLNCYEVQELKMSFAAKTSQLIWINILY